MKDLYKGYIGFLIHILLCFIGLFNNDYKILCLCMILGVVINGCYLYMMMKKKSMFDDKQKKYENLIESLVHALIVSNHYDFSIEDKQGQAFLEDVLNLIKE